jgi:hypothetical protein
MPAMKISKLKPEIECHIFWLAARVFMTNYLNQSFICSFSLMHRAIFKLCEQNSKAYTPN